jgi:hypothetical protein
MTPRPSTKPPLCFRNCTKRSTVRFFDELTGVTFYCAEHAEEVVRTYRKHRVPFERTVLVPIFAGGASR